MRSSILRLSMMAIFVASTSQMYAQKTIFRYLDSIPNLKITLVTDWDELLEMKDDSEVDGTLYLLDETYDIELTLRGKYRRRFCDFPPIELKFKKKGLREKGYDNDMDEFNDIKVVTHCLEGPEGLTNLYEELLIYELYQILTDQSFHVIHADMAYTPSDEDKEPLVSEALLVEPTDEMAWRLGGEEVEKFNMSPDSLDPDNYNTLALFQFMVGNFDWDHVTLKNMKMICVPGPYILVPYDFDFSAIVYPAYGRMPEQYPLNDFRDRIYLGRLFFDELPQTIEKFLSKEDAILAHVEEFPYLDRRRSREITKYLKQFFRYISKVDNLENGQILRHQ